MLRRRESETTLAVTGFHFLSLFYCLFSFFQSVAHSQQCKPVCLRMNACVCAHVRVATVWPFLRFPGKPACFHDNVCRRNSVFVFSWIRSETVSSALDARTHTPAHVHRHTNNTKRSVCIHHATYAQRVAAKPRQEERGLSETSLCACSLRR